MYAWQLAAVTIWWFLQHYLTHPLTSLLYTWGLRRYAQGPSVIPNGLKFIDVLFTTVAVILIGATILFVTLFPFQWLCLGLTLRYIGRVRVHVVGLGLRACAGVTNWPMLILTPVGFFFYNIGHIAAGCTLFLIGVLSFTAWFMRCGIRRRAARVYPYRCKKCGYNLNGLPSGRRCPECGNDG